MLSPLDINEIIGLIFNYLDEIELTKCRLVNLKFKSIADNPLLYPIDIYKIKKTYNNFCTHNKEIDDTKLALTTKLNELKSCTNDNFGYYVSKINYSIITPLFKVIPSINRELTKQNTLIREIEYLNERGRQLINVHQSVVDQTKLALLNYQEIRKTKQGLKHLWTLFGGKEHFEKLPVLDIGDKIDFDIKDMSAPVMKIKTTNYHYFSIRAKDNTNHLFNLTIRLFLGSGCWLCCGDFLNNISMDYLIVDGQIRDHLVFNKLKLFLEQGNYDQYTLI